MKTVEFMAGCPIAEAARLLVATAVEHGAATGDFNGVTLVADQQSTALGIVAIYDAESTARATAYRNSPEGREAERQREARRSDLQARHDAYMRKLPTLDFTNEVAVLDWLCGIQDATDHVGVIVRRETILATFERHGFKPNVNCGADFRKGSRDNEYRWLVGQALETLRVCAIHSLIHKFAKEWKEAYAQESVQ